MCLGIPGKVISIDETSASEEVPMTMGKVSFSGVVKDVCLAYVPDVKVGEYVIVHAGFALNTLNEDEAMEVFDILRQMGELAELETAE